MPKPLALNDNQRYKPLEVVADLDLVSQLSHCNERQLAKMAEGLQEISRRICRKLCDINMKSNAFNVNNVLSQMYCGKYKIIIFYSSSC